MDGGAGTEGGGVETMTRTQRLATALYADSCKLTFQQAADTLWRNEYTGDGYAAYWMRIAETAERVFEGMKE